MLSLLKIKIKKLKFGCLPSESLLAEKKIIIQKKWFTEVEGGGGREIEGKWAEAKGI